MTLKLPPAQNDFELTVTIGKKARPYFEEWYNAEKKDGETPSAFTFRQLKELAIIYRMKVLSNQDAETIKATVQTLQDGIEVYKQEATEEISA